MPTVSWSVIKERAKDFAVRVRARVYAVAGWLWSQRVKLQRLNASVGWMRRNAVVLLGLVGLAALVAVVLFATPAPGWLPEPKDTGALLGALLGAQAAIAALTLAVTLFVMQGISARVDVDERMYREYIHRAWVWPIFWISLATVGVTGLVLLTQQFSSRAPAALDAMPGLPNLTLFAAVAFLANLVLAGVLFRRALHQNSPEQWRALRLDVNKRDVREAVRAFLGRTGEGSAKEAVQNLLDHARRAMDERRLVYFQSSLESIRDLVTYAMDEIEREGLSWNSPGSQPQWPPLRELSRSLFAFRESIVRGGDQGYISELHSLDSWLLSTGVRRRCGELFTVALDGYRQNYQIARQIGTSEPAETLRDLLWIEAHGLVLVSPLDEIQPYVSEMVRHQERLLADAMGAGQPGDYEGLHNAFGDVLRAVDLHRDNPPGPWGESAALSVKLEQDYRIALMGLGGRALFLTESAKLTDPSAYVALTRDECGDLEQLADDIAQALVRGDQWSSSLWSQWESEGYGSYEVHSIQPEQYPLAFFCLRLLELVTEGMPTLNLHGRAKEAQGWFETHSHRFENYLSLSPDASVEKQRELALDALRDAVRVDEVATDLAIISWGLSEERIASFKEGVIAGASDANFVERVFRRAEAFLELDGDAADAPRERGFHILGRKAFLSQVPDDAHVHYEPLPGDHYGRQHSHDAMHLLCEALDETPASTATLDSAEALLKAVDAAMEEMRPTGEVIILLAGRWNDVRVELATSMPDGFARGSHLDGEVGRYRDNPILTHYPGERRLYIVEPGSWGQFVRARFEDGQELRVQVDPISEERAKELLDKNPNYMPEESEPDAKLRKLQTFVELRVASRVGFRVADASRARRIIPAT